MKVSESTISKVLRAVVVSAFTRLAEYRVLFENQVFEFEGALIFEGYVF